MGQGEAGISAPPCGTQVPPGIGGRDHQIVILPDAFTRLITVTCSCLRNRGLDPLGVRRRWGGGEARGAWLAHLAEAGVR